MRPTRLILAEVAARPQSRPRYGNPSKSGPSFINTKDQGQYQTPHVLVHEIPKTATPSDVLRALKERGLVSPNFAITNITPAPISLPRAPSLTRTYHITLPTANAASRLVSFMHSDSLFPYTTLSPSQHTRKSILTTLTARQYHEYEMSRFELEWDFRNRRNEGGGLGAVDGSTHFDRKRMLPHPNPKSQSTNVDADGVGVVSSGRSETSWLATGTGGSGTDGGLLWGLSGKRVYLRGLTAGVSENVVRTIVAEEVLGDPRKSDRETGLLSGHEGVYKLPFSPPGKMSSSFVLTFETVTQAALAARKLNMATHTPPPSGNRGRNGEQGKQIARYPSVLRAEVVW